MTKWCGAGASRPTATPKPSSGSSAWATKGWTAPTWPTEYGGGGLSRDEAKVLSQEMARIKAQPPLFSFGLWMLGPVLLEYANEEQKKEHLPKIVRGEIRWCQGYSEPGAGSDLAGLRPAARTRAITTSSTARRSGPPMPTRPTGFSAWCAPTRRRSMKASPSSSSTWPRPASRPVRSSSSPASRPSAKPSSAM